MKNHNQQDNSNMDKVLSKLQNLEARVSGIEKQLKTVTVPAFISDSNDGSFDSLFKNTMIGDKGAGLESKIGEYGLAWLGSIVLLLGITFLMSFINKIASPVVSNILGYTATLGVFVAAHFMKKSSPHLVRMLKISAHVLFYYITLHLHFFSANPVIGNKAFAFILLLLVVGVQFYFALRQKSQMMAGLAIISTLLSALFFDFSYVTLSLIILTAGMSLLLFIRYAWTRILMLSVSLVYLSFLLWLIGNPIMGHVVGIQKLHQHFILYLFASAAIFSMVTLVKQNESFSDRVYIIAVLWNAMCFSFLAMLTTFSFFKENYTGIFSGIAVFCLLFSVMLKLKTERKFSAAFYACFGFVALSVVVYGFAKLPDSFFYLALQSLLVVSMALWFRSKIIVIANTLLYVNILLLYMIIAKPENNINFSFAFVALATARVLNWKKERLVLQTEFMRNIYLFAAFITVLWSLYHAVPANYVSLSWIAVSAVYFTLSFILHNAKYRWMAIGTVLVTVVYLFIFDLARMEAGYRVLAFLFLAILSIGVSLYYTKHLRKKNNHNAE